MTDNALQISYLKKNSWPIGILLFFAVVISVNGVILTLALQDRPQLWESDPYEKGLSYQDTINRTKRVNEFGWNYQLSLSPATQGTSHIITLTLRDRTGAPCKDLQVELRVLRPSSKDLDRLVHPLDSRTVGEYSAPVDLISGPYFVTALITTSKGEKLQIQETLHVS